MLRFNYKPMFSLDGLRTVSFHSPYLSVHCMISAWYQRIRTFWLFFWNRTLVRERTYLYNWIPGWKINSTSAPSREIINIKYETLMAWPEKLSFHNESVNFLCMRCWFSWSDVSVQLVTGQWPVRWIEIKQSTIRRACWYSGV